MRPASITVTTGSRLHFGMFSFGQPGTRQFGGVGAMIDAPQVAVRLTLSETWEAYGPLAKRALATAQAVVQSWGDQSGSPCRLEVLSAPRQHVGLGSGTQLALAVTRGLHELFDRKLPEPHELARQAGRGRRSAIGLHGFLHGGLLMESGKKHAGEISPLGSRVELPTSWRWVLLCPANVEGLSGPDEQAAFDRLPPVAAELSERLQGEAEGKLLPAARAGDFASFSRSLFRFGQLAGACFKSQQGGTYATPELAALVRQVRELGVEGVGQSSWGPTLFALTPDQQSGDRLIDELWQSNPELELSLARPLNAGAKVHRVA